MSDKPKPEKPPKVTERTVLPDGRVIRKGQRKPYRKCTEEERDNRIHALAEYWNKNPLASSYQLRRWVQNKYNLNHNTGSIYVGRARELVRKQSSVSREEILDLVVPKLMRLTQNKLPRIAVAACRELINIAELGASKKIELSGPEGGPIVTKDETDPLYGISIERLKEIAAGKI